MLIFDQLCERRIEEALARGEFDNLPGAGAPLALDDDALVPEELRAAYRLLKNAGYVPPEVTARKQAASLRSLIAGLEDEGDRRRAQLKLQLLSLQLSAGGRGALDAESRYGGLVLDRLAGER